MIKELEVFFRSQKQKRVDVVSGKHTRAVARQLQSLLIKKGYICHLYQKPPLIAKDHMYIIFAPQIYKKLPRNYCVYQVEQLTYDYCNTEAYHEILNKAYAIFDYAKVNWEYLNRNDRLHGRVYYLPFDVNKDLLQRTAYEPEKKYDILFYGATSSERRKKYFTAIRSNYSLKVINDLFGERLFRELKKARIIVNIHYKDHAILETCRLTEVLALGNSIVISEESVDQELDMGFAPYVEFVPEGDEEKMVNRIQTILNERERIPERIQRNREKLLAKDDLFLKYAMEYF